MTNFDTWLRDVASVDAAVDTEADLARLTQNVADNSWRDCAHRADYRSAAEHERDCPYHNGEVDENGLPILAPS